MSEKSELRIVTGKKQRQRKLQRSQKVQKWANGHSDSWCIKSSLYKRFLNTNKLFKKNKVVTDKTLFIVTGPFCTHHSICLNIGFRLDSFVCK